MLSSKSSEKSRAFGHPTLDNTQQCSTFVEQCIVKSRERLAEASKLTFSEKTNIFFGKSSLCRRCVPLFSGRMSDRAVFSLLGLPSFFVPTFNQAYLIFERNFNIQTATNSSVAGFSNSVLPNPLHDDD